MRRTRIARVGAAIAAATLGVLVATVPAVSASAAVPTTVAFQSTSPLTVAFGEAWTLTLTVSSSYDAGPTLRLGPNDGTVDVYVSGIAGAFESGLPIQPDGIVYVSQPTAQPLLSAGEYELSAIYNPAPGGYYASSKTTTQVGLTVTGFEVMPSVSMADDAAVSDLPVITASLAGSYVEATGGAPAGTWHFTVMSAQGQSVFDNEIAQQQGVTDPVRVTVNAKLDKGATYTVMSVFTPVDELAGGITVSAIPDATYQTPSGTFAEAVTAPVPVPLWLGIVLLAVLIGLIAAAVAIGVALSKRPRSPAVDTEAGTRAPGELRLPGDPIGVEFATLNDLGLPEPQTIPELLPEGQTAKLPVSTTWLLSDVEPATRLPDASEAQTERLETVTAAEAPTELIETEKAPGETEAEVVSDDKPGTEASSSD